MTYPHPPLPGAGEPPPQLVRGLPPPRQVQGPPQRSPEPVDRPTKPRPFSLSLSVGMTIVASVEWIFTLLFVWLFMAVGTSTLDSQDLGDAGLYRIMSSWTHQLANGLAVPLLILPLAAILMALLVLYRKPAMRLMYTVVGVVTVGWSIWWLHDGAWWVFVLSHVGICLALVWLPRVTAWYDDAQLPDPAPF